MDKELIIRLHACFEDMVCTFPETDTEFWCARDLQELLGYTQWKNFSKVIDKAITACQTASYDPRDHFADVGKMVDLGSGATREIADIALSRYACYLWHADAVYRACVDALQANNQLTGFLADVMDTITDDSGGG